jgi:predicted enzyme related to lactoylglutathione lyase
MPTRESAPNGAPCWVDLFSADTDRAIAFYGDLFGWTAETAGPEYGGYINFSKDGLPVAGCMRNDGSMGAPDAWSVYLATSNAEATVDSAVAHGGGVIVPAMAVGELGTMAVMTDAGGAAIGAWQPGQHKGFFVLGEPGTPNWFELHARDFDASVKFYETVFNWDTHPMSDTPEFKYTTFGEGETATAGIMDSSSFLPAGVPAHWAIYFGVVDVDRSLSRIVEMGGSVLQGAQDSPYGRTAQAADPTGAMFMMVTPPSA